MNNPRVWVGRSTRYFDSDQRQHDPPPDLVLEIDVTSYSDVWDYLPYQVPEVWLFRKKQLLVYQLQKNEYIVTNQSRYFPEMNLPAMVTECLQVAYDRNTSAAIRHLKNNWKIFDDAKPMAVPTKDDHNP